MAARSPTAQIWETIGDGKIESLAKLGNYYRHKYDRPFRVAINGKDWWREFTDGLPPIIVKEGRRLKRYWTETHIMERIGELFSMNIQVWFVFGHTKRRVTRRSNNLDLTSKHRRLEHMLEAMNVPHHRVEGDPTWECCRLQRGGIVDAVWSESSHPILLNCSIHIRFLRISECDSCKSLYNETTQKVLSGKLQPGREVDYYHVRLYLTSTILKQIKLSRQQLTIMTLWMGGTRGSLLDHRSLQKAARHVLTRDTAWARDAFETRNQSDILGMTKCMGDLLKAENFDLNGLSIQLKYSDLRDFQNLEKLPFRHPSSDQLEELRKSTWERPLNEFKLRGLLFEAGGMATEEYIRWSGPGLLGRLLMGDNRFDPSRLGIKIGSYQADTTVVRVSFRPYWLPNGTNDVYLKHEAEKIAKDPSEFLLDTEAEVEAEYAGSLIEKHLPQLVEQYRKAVETTKLKRKREGDSDDNGRPAKRTPQNMLEVIANKAKSFVKSLEDFQAMMEVESKLPSKSIPMVTSAAAAPNKISSSTAISSESPNILLQTASIELSGLGTSPLPGTEAQASTHQTRISEKFVPSNSNFAVIIPALQRALPTPPPEEIVMTGHQDNPILIDW
ncbi:hypothetical protein ABW20_dc0107657 [Dactylellina cionopaga]|nr:hypothetical protein ABW20_dc0107657 [Dactylellina cionopaga]